MLKYSLQQRFKHNGGKFMTNNFKPTNSNAIFADCLDKFHDDSPAFFQLLNEYVDINEFISREFHNAFYKELGRKREFPLTGFISALILQKLIPLPTDSLLIFVLNFCKELRLFCGFNKVPDAPMLTRFKQNFLEYIEKMFDDMAEYTEPICQEIDSTLADMLAFDTSGIELYVKENNPKAVNSLIRKLKAYYKDKPEVDPYKMAYGLMPPQAESCPDAKQQYINGHFCYADKFAIITNGLGVVRYIAFLDDDLKENHPEMVIEQKSDSPNEDKTIGDVTALEPILSDFFALHPSFTADTFLGDSAFDTIETYGLLKDDFGFSRVLIPYNPRNESDLPKVGYNEYGYPTCPKDPYTDMKCLGLCHEEGRADRIKWGCPKMHMVDGKWVCKCLEPCSSAKRGRTTYTYENMDFRTFPGIQRDSEEWISLYKIRTTVERTINHIKNVMGISQRKTRNHETTKADVYFAGIASQLTAVIAYRIGHPEYIRSLKSLIA